MDRITFETRLRAAAGRAVEIAREYVRQAVPDAYVFRVFPNQSHDRDPRGDEVTYPADSLAEGVCHGPWSVAEVVEFLWRSGKVPEWIDAWVDAQDGGCSVIPLLCCGRFTAQDELLYHRGPGRIPPFSVQSPRLPPGWTSIEASGRFDLQWRDVRNRPTDVP